MSVLADTHALHWVLTAPERLSAGALERLHAAERDDADGIVVSVASRIDLHYLTASGRLEADVAERVWAVTAYPDVNVRAVPVSDEIAERFGDRALVGFATGPVGPAHGGDCDGVGRAVDLG